MLRQQLIDVQTKMSKMLASVQLLSDSVTKTLDDTRGGESEPGEPEQETEKKNRHASDASLASLDLDTFDSSILDFDGFVSAPISGKLMDSVTFAQRLTSSFTASAQETTGGQTSELVNVAGTNPFYSQIPNIWSHEYQMGMEPYLTAINATAESSMVLGKDYTFTNSPFSDHIQLLQKMLKTKLNTLGFVPESHHPVQRCVQASVVFILMI